MKALANQNNNIVIVLESTGHYWFNLYYFIKDLGIKLVLVSPFHVKQRKELDDNYQTKNDSKDPKKIAKLVIEGRYFEHYISEGIYIAI